MPDNNLVNPNQNQTDPNQLSFNNQNNPENQTQNYQSPPPISPGFEISHRDQFQINQPTTYSQAQPLQPNPQAPEGPRLPSETIKPVNSAEENRSSPGLKKFLISLFVILIILLLGAGYWYYFAKRFVTINVNPNDAEVKVDDIAVAANQRISLATGNHNLKVSRSGYVEYQSQINIEKNEFNKSIDITLKKVPAPNQVFDKECLHLAKNIDGIFCLSNSGKTIYRIVDSTGAESPKAVTPNVLAGVEQIIFNPKSPLAIIKVTGSEDIIKDSVFSEAGDLKNATATFLYDFNRYNLVNQEVSLWGNDIYDLTWTPDGKYVYYVRINEKESSLVKSGTNNQEPEIVLNFQANDIENPKLTMSEDGSTIALSPRSKNYPKNYIYYFDTYQKSVKKAASTGNVLGASFSPDSKSLAFTNYKENPTNRDIFSNINLKTANKENSLETYVKIDNIKWLNAQNFLALISSPASDTLKIQNINIETQEKTDLVWESGTITLINSYIISNDNRKIYFSSNNDLLFSLEIVLNQYLE